MADTLLLVDDDASVIRAIGDYFERIGYEVWRDGARIAAGLSASPYLDRPGDAAVHAYRVAAVLRTVSRMGRIGRTSAPSFRSASPMRGSTGRLVSSAGWC